MTAVTCAKSAGPLGEGWPPGALMNSSASPTLILFAVPAIQVLVSPGDSCHASDVRAGMAL